MKKELSVVTLKISPGQHWLDAKLRAARISLTAGCKVEFLFSGNRSHTTITPKFARSFLSKRGLERIFKSLDRPENMLTGTVPGLIQEIRRDRVIRILLRSRN